MDYAFSVKSDYSASLDSLQIPSVLFFFWKFNSFVFYI